ncbi:acyl-CoA dehydrogenase family protein [Tamaricihabitans halophyticus]|uniref:acyl-CoA dehydrogenase family protein n=1 Tax=Tamaricihabitans halophyticus TaxID=1262583 RepID=UPI001FB4FF00|nr:acyl-CoA dehydrogenase family protein [Tamaricihabitans halophyticus]
MSWSPTGRCGGDGLILTVAKTDPGAAITVHIGRVCFGSCVERHPAGTLDVVTAAMTKWWVIEQQVALIDRCLHCRGGYGYMREYPVARAYQDARIQKIPAAPPRS